MLAAHCEPLFGRSLFKIPQDGRAPKCMMLAAHREPSSRRGLFRIPQDGRAWATSGRSPCDMSTVSEAEVTPRATERVQRIFAAGHEIRWLTAGGQKWVHAGDLCEALGYCPSDVCHVQDRTKSAVSMDICGLPPEHRLVSREGVEILLNGCCGHHASRVVNAVYAEIYRDSAAAAMGLPSWKDHERLRRMVESGA